MPVRSRIDGVEVAGWPSHRIARAGRQHRVPAFAAAAAADRAGKHQARALARLARCGSRPRTAVTERARAIARARRLGRRARPPSVHAAVRRSAPDGNRQGGRARSQGAADRRAVRRADADRDQRFSPISSAHFRDEGRAVLLVDHSVKSVAALADRVSPCISASASPKAPPTT